MRLTLLCKNEGPLTGDSIAWLPFLLFLITTQPNGPKEVTKAAAELKQEVSLMQWSHSFNNFAFVPSGYPLMNLAILVRLTQSCDAIGFYTL